ncbi:MAG: cobalamin-independent methionine synthase II family protein [Alphaproteobacteria bacterium]|nr:cobalamin-independent methionine synthase II family protein [Alphaproteobacteria bacterium]
MAAPCIKTTVVGSYPVPEWFGHQPSEQMIVDATRVILHTQEQCGIDLVCDGEVYRYDLSHPDANGMIEYFTRPMSGIRSDLLFDDFVKFEADSDMLRWRRNPAGAVIGPVGNGTLNLQRPCQRAMELSTVPLKFTVTGPHMIAKSLVDYHYKDLPQLCHAIADLLAAQVARLDAPVIQLDEANLPGHPDEWEWAASAINRVLDAVKTTAAVHLCFGNYGGQRSQRGTWARLMDYLNALHVDHIIMECKMHAPETLVVFRDLRPDIGFGVGVCDVKTTVAESPDEIARDIERMAGILGPERIRYIHPDCGLWNHRRYVADRKIRALKLGRDLYEGRVSPKAA